MSRAARVFWCVFVAEALLVVAWAGYHQWVRRSADVILVKGESVDPRDLLRGVYMRMNYEISTVALAAPEATARFGHRVGDEVWVLLKRRETYYEVARASQRRPSAGPGQKLVRGGRSYDVLWGEQGNARALQDREVFCAGGKRGTAVQAHGSGTIRESGPPPLHQARAARRPRLSLNPLKSEGDRMNTTGELVSLRRRIGGIEHELEQLKRRVGALEHQFAQEALAAVSFNASVPSVVEPVAPRPRPAPVPPPFAQTFEPPVLNRPAGPRPR